MENYSTCWFSIRLPIIIFIFLLLVVVHGDDNINNNKDCYKEYCKSIRSSSSSSSCDIYRGRWVYDSSYPLYEAANCPFLERQFACQYNGRPDTYFLNFRWQPSNCFLPRFDGVDFLTKLRGKKLLFVGDSLSLNQWQSLACMLHTAVPQSGYKLTRIGGLSEFRFTAYNASLMLHRDGFLVKIVNEEVGKVMIIDSVSQGNNWEGFDILIFNTWHWWLHTGRKQTWDYIQEGNKLYKDMDRLVAFEKGLRTWAKWVETHLNSTTTKVYFQGISPDHMSLLNWTSPKARSCIGVTRPLIGVTTNGVFEQHPAERILEKVLKEMKRHVNLLKVTPLSMLRGDGHPGVYGIGKRRLPDCSHWCLPGVPDTWNHLLYASLLENY